MRTRLYGPFDREALNKAIPKPEKTTAEQFGPAAEELFNRFMQMMDNAGATPEHRALELSGNALSRHLCQGSRGIWAGLFTDRSGSVSLATKLSPYYDR